MKKIITLIIVVILITMAKPDDVFALEKIEVTTVDPQATEYGTFQSHNQKVVSNQNGIFMSTLHTRTDSFLNNTWRLSRSTDGGKTFTIVYETTNSTHAPAIETDPNGNIYAAVSTNSNNATIFRFSVDNQYSQPETVAILPEGSAQKFAMILDGPRQQIYYLATHELNNFRFYKIGLDGQVKINTKLTSPGSSANAHYPYLYLDKEGVLYAAWTTLPNSGQYLYWDIHFILSKDGGQTWQKPDGTLLSLPIVADQTGPTDRITLNDEFDVHTWLWNLIVKNDKVHFAYMAQFGPPKQEYVRYNLATNQIDERFSSEWKGETISFLNLDGFCTTRSSQANFPLYCISKTSDRHLGVLISSDNGQTWHDYAISDFNDQNLYSIGGAREVGADGYIIGSYTDARGDHPPVRFFRIKTVYIPGDLNGDGKVDIFDYNLLVTDFGKSGSQGFSRADIDSNGKVDIFDYNILVENFGRTQ